MLCSHQDIEVLLNRLNWYLYITSIVIFNKAQLGITNTEIKPPKTTSQETTNNPKKHKSTIKTEIRKGTIIKQHKHYL